MRFRELDVAGCYEIQIEPRGDERGWFSRVFCSQEFADIGLETNIVQINSSLSRARGTLRGLHFQRGPFAETKLVRVVRGEALDVVLDLRKDSATFRQWTSLKLSDTRRNFIYVPQGCAHGILTMAPDTELLYAVSAPYNSNAEGGVRWNDPAFSIRWPLVPAEISAKDRDWPDWPTDGCIEI
jgi:dTDP-4-dehydrorhamnose 3,5-epimerase